MSLTSNIGLYFCSSSLRALRSQQRTSSTPNLNASTCNKCVQSAVCVPFSAAQQWQRSSAAVAHSGTAAFWSQRLNLEGLVAATQRLKKIS